MRRSSSPSDGGDGPPAGGLFDAVLARGAVPALVGDHALLQAMLDAEAALATAQAKVGLLPGAHAEAIAAACRAGHFDVSAIGREAAASGNPVVPLVRALTGLVRDRAGEDVAGWVHHGATSQDILDTAMVLVTRAALEAIAADLGDAAATAADLARDHATTPMPGRTLLQQALPISFGLKAAGWLVALDDAAATLTAAAGGLPAQLGGAAGTLASLEEHGTATLGAYAEALELAEPVLAWHTIRLPVATVATAAGAAAGLAGKVALDVVLLAQTEVAEVTEDAAGRGGSSTMPHKRNPVAAIAAIAGARRTPGLVATLLATMGQEHERAAGGWHAEWAPLRELLVATGSAASWVAESLRTLRVDPERMRADLELTGGLLLAERVTAALRPTLGRLAAHDLVETACRRAASRRRPLLDELLDTPAVVDALGAERVGSLLDPAGYLGSSQELIERALRRHAKGPP
jgi:3-carboxy-cis,cis-muconate cycloisomerase